MRLLSEAFHQIKSDDPHTALTLCGLRRLINNGEIPSVRIGRKVLINYDALLGYLNTPVIKTPDTRTGQIRQVNN